MLLIGIVFIIAAFGFKVSAVPFHFWAPDTYEGSPTPLAAFLSVASKAAGFVGLLLHPAASGSRGSPTFWGPIVGAIAIATMTVGNVVALRQRQLDPAARVLVDRTRRLHADPHRAHRAARRVHHRSRTRSSSARS